MQNLVDILIILAYLSLLIEIVLLPVPSIASTYQLLNVRQEDQSGLLHKVQNWTGIKKFFFLAVPTSASVIFYCLPLAFSLLPERILLQWGISRSNDISVFIGLFLIYIGRIISLAGTSTIRKNNSQQHTELRLKTNSIFGFSRNPITLGMHIFYIGIILIYPEPILIAAFAVYVVNMDFRLRLEEVFLRNTFGQAFDSYAQKTRRYI